MPYYYAVKKGLKPGIYNTWDECKINVLGFKGSVYKKFITKNDALEFINNKLNNTIISSLNNILSNKEINVYTDGSCLGNGTEFARAGIGIFISDDDSRNVSEKIIGNQTNNYAELSAVLRVFQIFDKEISNNKIINIYTDSEYAINCLTTYGKTNNDNNWKEDIPNKELVKKTFKLFNSYDNVNINYVQAHTNKKDIHSINNNKADLLAKLGAKQS